MRWTRTLRLRLRSLLRSSRVERELHEEFQYHLDRLVDEYVARGLSATAARDAARREMGAIEVGKDACRDARGVTLIEHTRQDVGYALRTFAKSPGFAAVAIASLALGIGANTAIFTLWNGLLRAPLPGVARPDELVILTDPNRSGSWNGGWNAETDGPRAWLTYDEFEVLRDTARSFASVMASQSSLRSWDVRLDGSGPERATGRMVSGGFFETLGATPAIGRLFTAADDRVETTDVVVSYAYWQRRFAGRPDVLGTSLAVQNAVVTIVGVAAPAFIGETSGQEPDIWFPIRLQPRLQPGTNRLRDVPPEKAMWLHVFARLRPGVTIAQADAEANAIFRAGLESFYGGTTPPGRLTQVLTQRLQLRPGGRGASPTRQEFSQSIAALLIAVGVLLLIACANLANLLLARGTARRTEIALRLSIGASRGRIMRQLVTESLTLSAIGGVAAIAVASVLHTGLVQMIAASDDRFAMRFTIDPLVVTFIVAVSVASALLFGALPAWQLTKTDAAATLKEQSRGAVRSPGQLRTGRLLVSLQLALSVPLLVGAGLLARTVYNLQHADLGFVAERLLLVRVDLRENGQAVDRVRRDVLEAIQRTPGVRAVSFSSLGLYSGGESSTAIQVEGYTPSGPGDRESNRDIVGPAYFSTLGIPMRLGRDLGDRDGRQTIKVCVINEAFARRFFDRRNPIGMRLTTGNDGDQRQTYEIVGVASDARTLALRGEVPPRYFVPAGPEAPAAPTPAFLIRTAGEPTPLLPTVRETISRVAPAAPISLASSLDDEMAPFVALDRAIAQIATVFGGVALGLVAIGLYGLLAYAVVRRTGEIAIRIALGARAQMVTWMILRETVGLVALGLALGGALAFGVSRVIDSRLYGVAPQDPLTLVTATSVLLVVALSAAYIPARRAAKLDPMTALR